MILSTSLYVKLVAYDGYIDASGNVVENHVLVRFLVYAIFMLWIIPCCDNWNVTQTKIKTMTKSFLKF